MDSTSFLTRFLSSPPLLLDVTLPIMWLSLAGVLTVPLLIGFALGYGARELISRRRREAARLRYINDDWGRLN